MVVHDRGDPFDEELTADILCFFQVEHEEIPVVIMSRILFVEYRYAFQATLFRPGLPHVPVGYQFLSVRVDMGKQDDHVVEYAHCLRVFATEELISRLDELVGGYYFRGMEPSVNPYDGFTFGGQGMSLFVGQVFGMRELLGNAFIMIHLLQVFGRSYDHRELAATFFCLADPDEFGPVGGGGQFSKVSFCLSEIG